jgi:uncharacterized protein
VLSVSRLSTTPIRSFALHHPQTVEIGPAGVADDRRFSLHTDDGRIFDATKLGRLVQLRAELAREDAAERLTVRLPSGQLVRGDVELGDPVQLDIYDRAFTARPVIGPWTSAISEWAGRPLTLYRSERRPEEQDRYAVSIVSEASVEELARQGNGGQPVDPRRFRMLIQVAGAAKPHEEDDWLGRDVRIGEAVVRVVKPDARCVITTQDPDTGERDFPTLHVIKEYRGLREGRKLDFGVYASVVQPGRVKVGDSISVA